MKKYIELNIDYIGGLGELTKEEEQALSKFFQERKLKNKNQVKTRSKTRAFQSKKKTIK